MAVLRSEIERALDEIVSNEEGMRFQGLATVLAKQRWPELIACERKKDLDHDFHEVETLAENDGVRSTINPVARREVLKRLLAESHKRAAAEAAAKSSSSKPKSRRKKSTKAADQTATLFGEES